MQEQREYVNNHNNKNNNNGKIDQNNTDRQTVTIIANSEYCYVAFDATAEQQSQSSPQ